jgi:hypothetical protein
VIGEMCILKFKALNIKHLLFFLTGICVLATMIIPAYFILMRISPTILKERIITNPKDSDDSYWFQANGITIISSINCIAHGLTPSIPVDIQKCDFSGKSCKSILNQVIKCRDKNTRGNIIDPTIGDNAWIYMAFGIPSGTINKVKITLIGTKKHKYLKYF